MFDQGSLYKERKVTTLQKISNDIKTAMKSGDQLRKNVLRMILSDIKYAQAAVNVHQELDEQAVMKVVASYHKKLKKSFDEFPDGDKKKELLLEIAVVEEYLPKMMSVEEIDRAIEKTLAAHPQGNFGELMKASLALLGNPSAAKELSERLKKIMDSRKS